VLPSSHASGELTTPSPHVTLMMHACPTLGQIQPFSIWQSGVQPSPPTLLPSSHLSPGSSIEFPQVIAALPMSMPPASGMKRPPLPLLPPLPLPLPLPPLPVPGTCLTPAQPAKMSPKTTVDTLKQRESFMLRTIAPLKSGCADK
jgi:hypothetical protein